MNGAVLSYAEQGRGQPVILIHGFLMDYRAWSGQISELAKNYRVIAYSLRHRWPNAPGRDDDGPPMSELSASVNTADLAALIKSLRLGRVHLVGHSGGAAVALRMARDYPELVRSMVLGEPGAEAFAVNDPALEPMASPQRLEQVRQAFERGDIESALQIVRQVVVGPQVASQPQIPWVRQMVLDNSWHLKSLWMRLEREPPITCEQARLIKTPTLLLGGEESPAMFGAVLNGLAKCLPNHRRATLPGASHGLQLDNPEGFNAAVLKFLEQQRTASVPGTSPLR